MGNAIQVNPVHVNTCCLNNGARQIVYYPQVAYCENYIWEHRINHAIYEQVKSLISLQVGNLPSTVDEMLGFYELKNNQRQLLSLSLSNYTYHKQAAHGMTYIKSLTFDFEKERICQLKDLFAPGADYVQRLSELVELQIIQRDIPLLEAFPAFDQIRIFILQIRHWSSISNYMKLHLMLWGYQCSLFLFLI